MGSGQLLPNPLVIFMLKDFVIVAWPCGVGRDQLDLQHCRHLFECQGRLYYRGQSPLKIVTRWKSLMKLVMSTGG